MKALNTSTTSLIALLFCTLPTLLSGQDIPAYFGAGNDSGMKVYASHTLIDTVWPSQPTPEKTISGDGLDGAYCEAARFLMQASLGFEERHVQDVIDLGIEAWIDSQFTLPLNYTLTATDSIFHIVVDSLLADGSDSSDISWRPGYRYFNYAWWQNAMTGEDLLRQKVAAALSEIAVISRLSAFNNYGYGLASYYDLLLESSFGNYEDFLYDLTLHPMMGWYLTYVSNPKTDTSSGMFPDENYAREIMQLFTIGIHELNLDGTIKTDVNGEEIETYDNNDIAEFAKIFTGLGFGDVWYRTSHVLNFNTPLHRADVTVPMIMYESQHEPGEKHLLNGTIVPAGQTGLEDIEDAIHNLFMHDNVGPFLSYRLIQRMVKSNPSPSYVARVASVFNDDGTGVRGNMKAVVKAILMDPEARDCSFTQDWKNSKLKEPLFRFTQFARLIDLYRTDGYIWNTTERFRRSTSQDILAATSVFNFFKYNDAPAGLIESSGLVAPEYQLHDSQTSVGFWNEASGWTSFNNRVFRIEESSFADRYVYWEKSDHQPYYDDTEVYLNWLDKNLTAGQMSESTRAIIRQALNDMPIYGSTGRDRISVGAYLALITAEFNVMR